LHIPPGETIALFLVEDVSFMIALELRFDFPCCVCGYKVGVTLRCEGHGLADNPLTVITVECPTCTGKNQIHFTPDDGRLHRITRERYYDGVPEMSCN
jgi:hypothetical protein